MTDPATDSMTAERGVVRLHHTAYVVEDMDQSLARWKESLGAALELAPTIISGHGVKVSMLVFPGGGRIELVQSLGAGSVVEFNTKETGRPDHICLECPDFDLRVKKLREDGGIVVRPPISSEAFGGRRICFVYYKHVGLIEWVEQ